jgi:L-iditol 2-dehydrogenase
MPSNVVTGDRVAVEPGVPCETCFLCMDGRYNLCEDVKFSGVYPDHGTIQRYKTHPAKWCHKLPPNVSYAEGALLEPLSVVMHGIKTAGLSLGRGAVICGAGPIGLIALVAARASGAHPLVITDLEAGRLAFAKKFVPTAITYQVDRNLDAESNAKKIRSLFDLDVGGEYAAPETVLECTGVENSVVTAAYTARRGGTVMVIGVGREIMNNLPFMHLSLAEVSVHIILSLALVLSRRTKSLTIRADRPQVHQPLSGHLAFGSPVSCGPNYRSQATCEPHIPSRESVGCAAYMRGLE